MAKIVKSGKLRPPPNESNSLAHTKTGHPPARTEQTLDLPDELRGANKFWSKHMGPLNLPDYSISEGTSSSVVHTHLNMIMKSLSEHLGFQIKDVFLLLDTIPDMGFLGQNKIIASKVEIRKDLMAKETEWRNIFGSETKLWERLLNSFTWL